MGKYFLIVLAVVMFVAIPAWASVDTQPPPPTRRPPLSDFAGSVLVNTDDAFEGYTLFAPLASTETYLVDNDGRLINRWSSTGSPGNSAYLQPSGNLVRSTRVPSNVFTAGGIGGRIEEYTWNRELIWSFDYASPTYHHHHDFEIMPNGNLLLIAWELILPEDALAAGVDPQFLPDDGIWADHIVEVNPVTRQIVWEWHVWDYLVQDYDPTLPNYGNVAAQPNRINLNYGLEPGNPDWQHTNAIDYNPTLDQILLSVHGFDEIWIIDRGSRELVYRWGNPQAYGGQGEQVLFNQHDAKWIEPGLPGEGNILIFNNGREESAVLEIEPPRNDDGSYADNNAVIVWDYRDQFFAARLSGAQRLPNGHTLVCDGPGGRFWEVNRDGDVVWAFLIPPDENDRNQVFRAERYAPAYLGIE